MQPVVSIIMPLYNASLYLDQTINSVLNQTYSNWELIIVDDGSKDKSYLIAEKFAHSDNRIKLYKNTINSGVAFTRNRAIDIAKGKYIALLDADDLWDKNKLEKQVNFIEENKYSIVFCGYTKMNSIGVLRGEIKVPSKMNYEELLKNCLINCITGVYDREKFNHIRFKQGKVEDYIFWLEMFKEVDYAYAIQESLAFYRVQENSRSSNKIDIVKYHWNIYRNIEKLGLFKSLYFFTLYICKGLLRYIK